MFRFTLQILTFLKEMPLSDHRDSACPFTPSETKRIERYPDFVSIGFPKCGTGTLAFFDCHSKIVFRESEAAFFNSNRWRKGINSYAIPFAAEDEILIEKTPNYSKGNKDELESRARIIKNTIPNGKILGIFIQKIIIFIAFLLLFFSRLFFAFLFLRRNCVDVISTKFEN